jgi:hypothetical protein
VGAALLTAFVLTQQRAGDPLIPPALLRQGSFRAAASVPAGDCSQVSSISRSRSRPYGGGTFEFLVETYASYERGRKESFNATTWCA